MLGRLRGLAKVSGFCLHIAAFILVLGVGSLFLPNESSRRWFRLRTSGAFNRWLLRWFGLHVTLSGGDQLPSEGTACFFVSNHLADIDAVILSSLLQAVFVTSVEISETPLLGLLSRLGGSVYVERRKRFTLPGELNTLVNLLNQGFSIALFPEGTSTNGEEMLPFKSALFRAAIAAEATVVPLCIQYTAIDGQPVTRANRDDVFYYGDMTFFAHLMRLCQVRSIEVRVDVLNPITLRESDTRKDIARRAHNAIEQRTIPVTS